MKLAISKEVFLKALQTVQSVISSHSTAPILFNVLLKAEKEKLFITATDLNVSMQCAAEATIKKTGVTTFNAKRLFSIVRELPQEEIDFEVSDDHTGSIHCGASAYKVLGLSADTFPALPQFDESKVISVKQEILREMLKKTVYAASLDASRMILNGVLMSIKDQKITVVATDGRRLALVEQEVELTHDLQYDLVIPTKTVNELIRILKDEGTVNIYPLDKMIAFQIDDVLVVSKLLEGNYPNFKQVIPSQCEERIAVDRENLLAAIRRVALMTSDKSPSVRINFAKNQIQITTATPDVGEASETIPVKYSGKELNMAFNPEYFMDVLRNLTSDEVAIELVDELSPAVIKCEIPFLYVLMPLRLN